MDLNLIRQIIKNEQPARLELGEVVAADGRDPRHIAVRVSGGAVLRNVQSVTANLIVGQSVLLAFLQASVRPVVVGAVQDNLSVAAGGSLSDTTLVAPSGVVAYPQPLFIFLEWDFHPSHTDICYQIQSSPDGLEATAVDEMITKGSYFLYAAPPKTTRYFRVRSIRYRGEQNITFSGWSGWVFATTLYAERGRDTSPDPDYGNLITVAKEGGDYTTLGAAMASIVVQSWERSVIQIYPGVYPNEDVTIKNGVSIVGVAGGLLAGSSVTLGGKLIIDANTATLGCDLANLTFRQLAFVNDAQGYVRVSKCLIGGSGAGAIDPIDMSGAKMTGTPLSLMMFDSMIYTPPGFAAKLGADTRLNHCYFYNTDGGDITELAGATRVEFNGCGLPSSVATLTLVTGCTTVFDGSTFAGTFAGAGTWVGQFLDGSGNLQHSGHFVSRDGYWAGQARTPTTLAADQNDYDPGSTLFLRLASSLNVNVTGLAGGANGRLLVIHNVGSFSIVLKHQDTGSAAANRLLLPNAANLTLVADATAMLQYDGTTARWRLLGSGGGLTLSADTENFLLGLTGSTLTLDAQPADTAFAGPLDGADAAPTFKLIRDLARWHIMTDNAEVMFDDQELIEEFA